jgi:hypothetical protein
MSYQPEKKPKFNELMKAIKSEIDEITSLSREEYSKREVALINEIDSLETRMLNLLEEYNVGSVDVDRNYRVKCHRELAQAENLIYLEEMKDGLEFFITRLEAIKTKV